MKSIAGVALLRQDGAVLLQKRDNKSGILYSGMWGFPGGHVKEGENIQDCAKRELQEETNYYCNDLEQLTILHDYPPNNPPYQLIAFWGLYDGIQQLECHEGQKLKFVFRSQIKKYPVPACVPGIWDLALEASKKRKDILP